MPKCTLHKKLDGKKIWGYSCAIKQEWRSCNIWVPNVDKQQTMNRTQLIWASIGVMFASFVAFSIIRDAQERQARQQATAFSLSPYKDIFVTGEETGLPVKISSEYYWPPHVKSTSYYYLEGKTEVTVSETARNFSTRKDKFKLFTSIEQYASPADAEQELKWWGTYRRPEPYDRTWIQPQYVSWKDYKFYNSVVDGYTEVRVYNYNEEGDKIVSGSYAYFATIENLLLVVWAQDNDPWQFDRHLAATGFPAFNFNSTKAKAVMDLMISRTKKLLSSR